MLSAIKSILAPKKAATSTVTNQDKIQLAASVLLLEAAYADEECSQKEMTPVVNNLQQMFKMSEQCVQELIEMASEKREQVVDLWQFTNLINAETSHQERISIMKTVWQIIYIDDKLDSHEDYFAHKLANLLHLSHSELIDAKLKAKNGQAK